DVTTPSARIAPYQHLMQRVDPKLLDALFEAPATTGGEAAEAKAAAAGAATAVAPNAAGAGVALPDSAGANAAAQSDAPATGDVPLPGGEAIAPTITIDDFAKIDLRIARIVECDYVEGAKK